MMKRIAVTGLSALILAGSFAGAASAADYRGNDRGDHRGNYDRRDNDRRDNDRRGNWNNGRHDQFNRSWRRGDRLPYGYQNRYREIDYRYYRLRPPPRGYHYVRDERGETLLVGLATGVILGVILGNN